MGILRCSVHGHESFFLACAHVREAREHDQPLAELTRVRVVLLLDDERHVLSSNLYCKDCAKTSHFANAPPVIESGEEFDRIASGDLRIAECARCIGEWAERHRATFVELEIAHVVRDESSRPRPT